MTILKKFELELEAEIPLQLKAFYLEIGNGGVGPDYGLWPIEEIIPYNPGKKWQGVDYYHESESEYEDIASGMLGIMDQIMKFKLNTEKMEMSPTEKAYTFMKFLAVDVDYRENTAFVAGVAFSDWNAGVKSYKTEVDGVEEYVSGEFYKRELPCILELLRENNLSPDCIIVDGFVFLEEGKPGLGKHLYDAMDGKIKVIGVAKNPRRENRKTYEVLRGKSTKPLYVTSVGIELELAKNIIKHMDGNFRLPTMLKLADTLCREK